MENSKYYEKSAKPEKISVEIFLAKKMPQHFLWTPPLRARDEALFPFLEPASLGGFKLCSST